MPKCTLSYKGEKMVGKLTKAQAKKVLVELSDKYHELLQDPHIVEINPAPIDKICEQHERLFEKHFPNKPYFGIDSESL